MFLKKTVQKTKNFFMKSLQNLKNFLFGSYDKVPRTLFLNPLSCSSINQRSHHLDHIYPHFSNSNSNPSSSSSSSSSVCSDHGDQANAGRPINQITNTDANHSNTGSLNATVTDHEMKQEFATPSKIQPSISTTTSNSTSFRCPNGGAYLLAQKMKELEMMDVGDVDQSLDVEEALHYYSRLTCPAYVDIVNKFFMDMYTDFHLPQPSITINSSSRQLGPLAL